MAHREYNPPIPLPESDTCSDITLFDACLEDSQEVSIHQATGRRTKDQNPLSQGQAGGGAETPAEDSDPYLMIDFLKAQLRAQGERIQQLERRLIIHPTTGLHNHMCLQDRLDEAISACQQGDTRPLAVVIFRLDSNFDTVNKTMKSSMSDWILYQVGVRLDELLQDKEELFHTRDDEFVVLLRRFTPGHSLGSRVQGFLNAISRPHVLAGRHIHLGANSGVAVYPDHGLQRSALLHNADMALDQAAVRRQDYRIFEDQMRLDAVNRMDLHAGILNALEAGASPDSPRQLRLVLQPQLHLELAADGSLVCQAMDAEVLLRWEHPRRGQISPDEFIPFSEESGLIMPLGSWVLYRSLELLKVWKGSHLEPVCLSVNISPKQFMNNLLMEQLHRELKNDPGLGKRLKLEITETCLLEDPEGTILRMDELRNLGLRFSLDDFGKGYSSLGYLSRLPLDSIKLDRGFIADIESNSANLAVIRAVILMARHLEIDLICEGVETTGQLGQLVAEGARGFQGYLFSKPVDATEFARLFHQRQTLVQVGALDPKPAPR